MASTAKKTAGAGGGGGGDGPLLLAKGLSPDSDAMRRAAAEFGLEVPTTQGEAADRELLGALRIKVRALLRPIPRNSQLECQKCGERSTNATEFCPFCGDPGIDESDDGSVAAEVVEQGVGIATTPSASPPRNLDAAMAELETKLVERLQKITSLGDSAVGNTWEMGQAVKEIHDQQLFKARGYQSFRQFADRELPMKRQTAYRLMQIVERFDRETFIKAGFSRLNEIVDAPPASRAKLLAEAKSGTSTRDLRVQSRPKKAIPKSTERQSAPPPADGKVTVLAKIDGKPKQIGFKSLKAGGPIPFAGKVKRMTADAYADVELTPDVFVRIALRTSGEDLIGLTVSFVRAKEPVAAE